MNQLARFTFLAAIFCPCLYGAVTGCGGGDNIVPSNGTSMSGTSMSGTSTSGTSVGSTGTGGAGNVGGSGSGTGGLVSAGGSASAGGAGGQAGGATGSGPVTASSGGGTTSAVSSGGGTTSAASGPTSGVGGAPMMVACQGHIYQCGDGVDNDGDGLVDSQDPDCLGACDNTEGSYYGGIPGQAGPPCTVDCYFDQDSGSGNDDCHWSHACDPHEVSPTYYPESSLGSKCAYDPNANTSGSTATCAELDATQSAQCMNFCGPLTPNGCDCFGCCNLPAGSSQYVWLGSDDGSGQGTCTIADVNDPTKCQPCHPVAACLNTCERCELCIGKTDVPADCYPSTTTSGAGGATSTSTAASASASTAASTGTTASSSTSTTASTSTAASSSSSSSSGGGVTGQCPAGVQPCGLPGEASCSAGYYCITGCCRIVLN